ncbi:hypothetical protein P7K49_039981 [Saguinus oedipus]|uniref:Uncharacterized protein n=1 Tax=Saguinus oedipus TaxID=9490 RepID=A0ABQ9TAE3_SAGOE|nr:hypothetical protein P7K49_039981 [Saguinus oedipus]
MERLVLRSLPRNRSQNSPSTQESYSAEFYCYFVICGKTAGKACFEISPQKPFPDFPVNTRVLVCRLNAHIDNRSAEFYCYFVICGKTAGKACFEISPQKPFPDFPVNTPVLVCRLNAHIDNRSVR